jgi:predicted O-methyltransferase YrrM
MISEMGRAFGHLTPRYIASRLRHLQHLRRHPDQPWLTPQANEMLESLLLPSDVGLEFGSGRSTIWLARRVRFLTSVEHDAGWHALVRKQLDGNGLSNVDYLFRPMDVDEAQGTESAYVAVTRAMPADSLDFVLVDGVYRGACATSVLHRLRPGGLLILDDAQRYLPSHSYSPGARRPHDGAASQEWATFLDAIGSWRTIWTSSGVSDTAIWFKPGANRR